MSIRLNSIFKGLSTYFKMLRNNVEIINKKNNRNKLLLAFDMLYCTIAYSASPNNYSFFEFYNLKHNKRKTYLTHGIVKKFEKKYNDRELIKLFDDKTQFAEKFSEFFVRDWINVRESDYTQFEKFIKNKEIIICKPRKSADGRGVRKYKISEFNSINSLYHEIKSSDRNYGIAEEYILQHEKLNELFSGAVNMLRVASITKNNNCDILLSYLSIYNGTDDENFYRIAIAAPVDIKTGILISHGADKYGNIYYEHPQTGRKIRGFEIPYWDKVIELVKKISFVIPQVKYVGWDIAISSSGPLVIEGNPTPSYTTIQNPRFSNIGYKALYTKYFR